MPQLSSALGRPAQPVIPRNHPRPSRRTHRRLIWCCAGSSHGPLDCAGMGDLRCSCGSWNPARLRPALEAVGLVAEGEDRCLEAVLQAEFGEDASDVGLDGLLADRQVPGDLPVAVTARDQLEYFAFARCERL